MAVKRANKNKMGEGDNDPLAQTPTKSGRKLPDTEAPGMSLFFKGLPPVEGKESEDRTVPVKQEPNPHTSAEALASHAVTVVASIQERVDSTLSPYIETVTLDVNPKSKLHLLGYEASSVTLGEIADFSHKRCAWRLRSKKREPHPTEWLEDFVFLSGERDLARQFDLPYVPSNEGTTFPLRMFLNNEWVVHTARAITSPAPHSGLYVPFDSPDADAYILLQSGNDPGEDMACTPVAYATKREVNRVEATDTDPHRRGKRLPEKVKWIPFEQLKPFSKFKGYTRLHDLEPERDYIPDDSDSLDEYLLYRMASKKEKVFVGPLNETVWKASCNAPFIDDTKYEGLPVYFMPEFLWVLGEVQHGNMTINEWSFFHEMKKVGLVSRINRTTTT